MTSKKLFLEFIKEIESKPYFATMFDIDVWSDDLDLIAKYLEAFDIIKKKNVDVSYLVNNLFIYQDVDDEDALEEYNGFQIEKYELTMDEYKLLKEELEK